MSFKAWNYILQYFQILGAVNKSIQGNIGKYSEFYRGQFRGKPAFLNENNSQGICASQ